MALAVVDAAVGVYLIRYALPREQVFLLMCAGLLVLLEVLLEPGQLIGETPPARQV